MSRCVLRVNALDTAAAIRHARQAADRDLNERREAVLHAIERINAGHCLTAVLGELALGMYLTGHLQAEGAAQRAQAEHEVAVGLLTEEARAAVRRDKTRERVKAAA